MRNSTKQKQRQQKNRHTLCIPQNAIWQNKLIGCKLIFMKQAWHAHRTDT